MERKDVYLPFTGKCADWVVHVSGETDLTNKEIKEAFQKEDPVIYWCNVACCLVFCDFIVTEKDGKKVWCESQKIDATNRECWVNLYTTN